MYKKALLLICLFILMVQPVLAKESPSEDRKWEYVVTRGENTYSVDMKSVKVSTGTLLFWMSGDNDKEKRIGFYHVAIKMESRECRFEEGFVYDKNTKKSIYSTNTPSEWGEIGNNSVLQIVIQYIVNNHALFKKSDQ